MPTLATLEAKCRNIGSRLVHATIEELTKIEELLGIAPKTETQGAHPTDTDPSLSAQQQSVGANH